MFKMMSQNGSKNLFKIDVKIVKNYRRNGSGKLITTQFISRNIFKSSLLNFYRWVFIKIYFMTNLNGNVY
jgi:hypothetical protein